MYVKYGGTYGIRITYASNVTSIGGGVVSGDDFKVMGSLTDALPYILLKGDQGIEYRSNAEHSYYVGATNVLHIGDDGYIQMLECDTPSAVANWGALYFKNDNKLYAQDGAGTEHEVAYVP